MQVCFQTLKYVFFIHQVLNHSELLHQYIFETILIAFLHQPKTELCNPIVKFLNILDSLDYKFVTIFLVVKDTEYFFESFFGKDIVDEIDINELILRLEHQLVRQFINTVDH